MSYEFIKELSEARVFKNPTKLETMGTGQIADSMFNAVLAIQIMRYENPKAAVRLAKQTLSTGMDGWRSSGSDLNNMAQLMMNPERYKDKIIVDRQVSLPSMQLKGWLRNIAQGREDTVYDRKFLLALQRQLGVISPGLMGARRLVADWPRTIGNERALAVTRVYRGMATDLKQSDMFAPFAKVANKRGMMIKGDSGAGGIPLWAKMAAAGAGGYALGKIVSKW